MKVFISADIEGVSGVVSWAQTSPEEPEYQRARILMTEEVNAAIEGAAAAGAEEIVVNDSHGPMTNLLIERLNPAAQLISGTPKRLGMMEGIDDSFDAVMLIGYHARMNSGGVLCHTYSGRVNANVNVGGIDSGEFYLNAAVAGSFGVPVVLVSGDDVLAREVKAVNDSIGTVTVKEARGRYAGKCLAPVRARELIRSGAAAALRRAAEIPPVTVQPPVELRLTFVNSGQAEAAAIMPRTELISPNTVLYRAESAVECYRAEMAMVRIVGTL